MKTNEIIAGLRKLCEQGSQYRRTVCRLAADRLEELDSKGVEIDQFNRWILVTERLPEEDVRVIVRIDRTVWNTSFELDADRRHNGEWVRWGRAVTHWREMPEPPKEVSV